MYEIEIREHLDKIFRKIKKKDRVQFEAIRNKLKQIQQNPQHFKPLHSPLQNKRRVHILKSFVLIYSIDEGRKVVIIEEYEHHNNVYKI